MLNNPNRPCGGFLFYKLSITSHNKSHPMALRKANRLQRIIRTALTMNLPYNRGEKVKKLR